MLPDLGCVGANPDTNNLWAGIPERNIFFDVSRPLQHGMCDRPVNVDLTPADIFEDPFIRCRFATRVVVLRKAVYGYRHPDARDLHPMPRDGNYRACHHHGMDVHLAQNWQKSTQLPVTYQGFTPHQGHV